MFLPSFSNPRLRSVSSSLFLRLSVFWCSSRACSLSNFLKVSSTFCRALTYSDTDERESKQKKPNKDENIKLYCYTVAIRNPDVLYWVTHRHFRSNSMFMYQLKWNKTNKKTHIRHNIMTIWYCVGLKSPETEIHCIFWHSQPAITGVIIISTGQPWIHICTHICLDHAWPCAQFITVPSCTLGTSHNPQICSDLVSQILSNISFEYKMFTEIYHTLTRAMMKR